MLDSMIDTKPEPTTEELVRAAQAGDLKAFEALYRALCGRVHAVHLRLTAEAELAEELTQDVFVRVWEKLGSFRGEAAFSTWVHRLAVNLAIDRLRAEGRRRQRIQDGFDWENAELAAPAAPPGVRLDLEKAIATLPHGARVIFVLHDIEGYRHGEIATLLGIGEGTSKAQLHRARRLLREVIHR
jgi:RNA polymerase sigma-70 factor, ECF subfamily